MGTAGATSNPTVSPEPPRRSVGKPLGLMVALAIGFFLVFGGGFWTLLLYLLVGVAISWFTEQRFHAPPALGGGTPTAAAGPQPHAHVQDVVDYLWTQRPQRQYRTTAVGLRPDRLRVPRRQGAGRYVFRLPFGIVTVYPQFLLFTTTRTAPPDEVGPSLGLALDVLRNFRRFDPIPLAREAVERLRKNEHDRLRGPLSNPSSIIVPLHTLRAVRRRQEFGVAWIELETTEGRILLGSPGWPSWRYAHHAFAGVALVAWEPRLYDLLSAAVALPVRRPEPPVAPPAAGQG